MKNNLGLFLRGLAMGAADIVPGVSGGTIALITGIYERLIDSLRNLGSIATLHELRTGAFKTTFKRADCMFLLCVFAGIGSSIVLLSQLIVWAIAAYPIPVWAFFSGLVLASAWLLLYQMKNNYSHIPWQTWLFLILGSICAFSLGRLTPAAYEPTIVHFFLGGAIAICAMILPGISGSFILLIMGMYTPLLNALHTTQVLNIFVFLCGCGIGLLSFSHVLSWVLHRFPLATHSLLIGLMLGSLEKIWPWKAVISTRINSHGEVVPLLEKTISPSNYAQIMQQDSQLVIAVFSACFAFLCILAISRLVKNDSAAD